MTGLKCSFEGQFKLNFKHSIFDWPGWLIEGNSANVEFLNLVDGTDSQSAVVGQSQTVKNNKMQQ